MRVERHNTCHRCDLPVFLVIIINDDIRGSIFNLVGVFQVMFYEIPLVYHNNGEKKLKKKITSEKRFFLFVDF